MAENARRTTSERIREKNREIRMLFRERQIRCDHKDKHGPILYEPTNPKVKNLIAGNRNFGEMDMICEECGEVINMESVTREDADAAFQTLYDVCNQTKLLCELNDNEAESIAEIMENLDIIKNSLMSFYENNVIKPLVNGGKGKKNNNTRQKGKMGISSNSYNRK